MFVHRRTGIQFPKDLGEMRYVGMTDFEVRRKGMGISVRYQTRGAHADVYVYDYNLRNIPNGANNKKVHLAFKMALREIQAAARMGLYRNIRRSRVRLIRFGKSSNRPTALLAILAYEMRRTKVISTLCIFGYNRHFVKLRFTHAAALRRGSTILKGVLKDLSELLSP